MINLPLAAWWFG